MYIPAPPNIAASALDCHIAPKHLTLKVRDSTHFYLNHDTFGLVDTSESTWFLQEDSCIQICLIKAHVGERWTCALLGGDPPLDAASEEELKQSLLKERFDKEHAGFDFSDAKINGSVPDARTFMGGFPSL